MPVNPNLVQIVSLRAQIADLDLLIQDCSDAKELQALSAQREVLSIRLLDLEQRMEIPKEIPAERITRLLGSSDEEEAIEAMQTLILRGAEVIDVVVEYMSKSTQPGTDRAARVLGRIGEPVDTIVPELLKQLQVSESPARIAAALVDTGTAALPWIIGALRDDNNRRHIELVKILRWFGPAAAEAVPLLSDLMKSGNPLLRAEIVTTLGSTGESNPQAIATLTQALYDPEPQVRTAAANSLGHMGVKAASAVPALIEALADENKAIRVAAAQALRRLGPPAIEAIFPLQKAMFDEYDEAIYDELEATVDHLFLLKEQQ